MAGEPELTAALAEVAVVIPSIGKSPHLVKLVRQLRHQDGVRTNVVVCMSGTQPPSSLAGQGLVRYSKRRELVSVARNEGANIARGDFICFVDDDNEVPAGMVKELASLLMGSPDVVLAGPAMYYFTDHGRPFCLGASYGRGWGRTQLYLGRRAPEGSLVDCDSMPNIFMVRRRDFERVGGFDTQDFPMDMEEADLAYRLRRTLGGRIVCDMRTYAYHDASLGLVPSLAPRGWERCYFTGRNRPVFVGKYFGIGPLLRYLVTWHVPLTAIKAGAILGSGGSSWSERLGSACAFVAGSVVGPILGVVRVVRRGGIPMDRARARGRESLWADV